MHGENLVDDPRATRINRAASDIGRLRLLDSTLRDEKLVTQEAKVLEASCLVSVMYAR